MKKVLFIAVAMLSLVFVSCNKDDERDGAFIEKDRNGKIISKGIYEEGLRQQD